MIDWSKLGWDKAELQGVAEIRILPRLMADKAVIEAQWLDAGGNVIRQDAHVEIFEVPQLFAEAQEL